MVGINVVFATLATCMSLAAGEIMTGGLHLVDPSQHSKLNDEVNLVLKGFVPKSDVVSSSVLAAWTQVVAGIKTYVLFLNQDKTPCFISWVSAPWISEFSPIAETEPSCGFHEGSPWVTNNKGHEGSVGRNSRG